MVHPSLGSWGHILQLSSHLITTLLQSEEEKKEEEEDWMGVGNLKEKEEMVGVEVRLKREE